MNQFNLIRKIELALCLIACLFIVTQSAHAQSTVPLPIPPGAPGTTFTIKSTTAGVDTITTYFIDAASANDLMWIMGQTLTNTTTIQNMKQYAAPVCLTGISLADNSNTFDWASNKMRNADWSLLSVTAAGIPYRNGVRLGTASIAQKLCLYGNDIYIKGNTDGRWAVWREKDNAWYVLPTNLIDPSIFN